MRKVLFAALFLVVVLSVWTAGNLYLARRLVVAPQWGGALEGALLVAVAALAALSVVQAVAEHRFGARYTRWMAWPAYVYMGFAFLAIVGLGLSSAVLAIGGAAFAANGGAAAPGTAVAAARAQAVVVAVVALVAGGLGLATAVRAPRWRRVEIDLDRWPEALDGFRIVQVSDVHVGALLDRRFAAAVVARVNQAEPDVVAVTGDLVDGGLDDLADEVAPFAALRARHGVYFVTGNHDYYSGADPWIDHLRGFGWRVLRNERVPIDRDGAGFDLAGVDDHRGYLFGGDHGEDVPRALAGRDPARPVVLLAHDPSTFQAASRHAVDLQLSGHTHGGQIWPFGYLVRLAVGYVAGAYARDGCKLWVSSGTGFWGPPMRLGAAAEITEIVLRSAAAPRPARSPDEHSAA